MSSKYWDAKDRIEKLYKLYPYADRTLILSTFPEKNWNAIAAFAHRRKIQRNAPHRLRKREYPKMNDITKNIIGWSIAWEGTISLYFQGRHEGKDQVQLFPSISIGNTDFSLLDKIIELTGYGHISKHTSYRSEENGKPLKKWEMRNHQEIAAFLSQILDYLPSKRKQGELLLEYVNSRLSHWRLSYTEREKDICRKMILLNKRGLKQ